MNDTHLSRRAVLLGGLKAGLGIAACTAFPSFARAATRGCREVRLHNLHTGEAIRRVYWENGNYHAQAMHEISYVLRDHRNNQVKAMDPQLIDLIAQVHRSMDSEHPFEVISGYRSPASNAFLHENTSGVATHSMHLEGKAIDVRLPGRSLAQLHRTALLIHRGGVGYYPSSDFVHMDTGRVRQWG